ncbi:replication initiation protein [Arsenophonus sp.]|uniref:replication initiation protein n=1 Tax=Arsenophonus sp. TaxID=1872640 RepID=UPI003879A950
MSNQALDYFNQNLPRKPYCTDDFCCGVRILPQAKAMLKRYIQHNPPHSMVVFAYDLDYQGGAIGWDERGCPPFNISAMSRDTATAHGYYIVNPGVRTAPDGSMAALKYGAAVQRGIRVKLGADPNYGNLLCKNPNHADWQVTQWRHEPYTLDELADYLDLSAANAPLIESTYGLGRNCTIFEKTRKWAYRAIRRGWPAFAQWFAACFERAMAYNVQFPVPLSEPEVKAIAKSIAKWTHRRFTEKAFAEYVDRTHTPEIQAIRGSRNSKEVQAIKGSLSHGGGRPIDLNSERQRKPWEELGISRAWYYQQKKLGVL